MVLKEASFLRWLLPHIQSSQDARSSIQSELKSLKEVLLFCHCVTSCRWADISVSMFLTAERITLKKYEWNTMNMTEKQMSLLCCASCWILLYSDNAYDNLSSSSL